MSQNGHDDTAPQDADEPNWAEQLAHANRLGDTSLSEDERAALAQGVAIESLERDRLTFQDRARFIERYERDQRENRVREREARRDRAALAGGLSNVLREMKEMSDKLTFSVALSEGIAAVAGVAKSEVDRLHKEAVAAALAQKVRDTAVERSHALMRAKLEEMSKRLDAEGRRIDSVAEKAGSVEDSTQRAVVTAAIAVDALEKVREASVEAAVAAAQRDVERDARRSMTNETTIIRTETRARSWSLREKVLAAIALSLVGGGGVVAQWLWKKLTEK